MKNNEIRFVELDGKEALCPEADCFSAYDDKKYLKEGKTFVIGRIKDYLSISVGFIAIVSAIITSLTAIVREKNNKAEIQNLQAELNTMKTRCNLYLSPKNSPLSIVPFFKCHGE